VAKILIVDDEPANRLLIAAILRPHGHQVLEAADGAEGLSLAHESAPDLIIIDLFMPGMGGAEFVKALRADSATQMARVALYTATRPDRALRDFMRIAGIAHVIPKPSEPAEVLRIVNDALAA